MVTKLNSLGRSFVLLICLFMGVSAMAQDRVVTGKISGGDEPLVGASVVLKGTTKGTLTDIDGNFSVSAPENSILVVSFVGYATQEIAVGNQTSINVTLTESTLDEVIVTGYLTERKRDLVGSVSVIDTKTTLQQPSSNVSNMLQGRAPGVTVSEQVHQERRRRYVFAVLRHLVTMIHSML